MVPLLLVGDTVQVVLRSGDTTPIVADGVYYYNGFTGLRI